MENRDFAVSSFLKHMQSMINMKLNIDTPGIHTSKTQFTISMAHSRPEK